MRTIEELKKIFLTRKDVQTTVTQIINNAEETNVVHLDGDETINGVKTFTDFPITPSDAPSADYEVANKKYVDDNAGFAGTMDDITDGSTYVKTHNDYSDAEVTKVSHAVISDDDTITNIIKLTQAEYTALGSYDSTTLYIIVG
jgi:hypothetical protein